LTIPGKSGIIPTVEATARSAKKLGAEPGTFADAYEHSDEEGAHQALEADVLYVPLWKLAEANKATDGWRGTASEMLRALRDFADDDLLHTPEWPKAPNVLSGKLRRLAALLRDAGGVVVEELPREGGTGAKRWLVKLVQDEEKEKI
jgi:hypothetical protein